tara:strand:- start:5046 stop:5261 length:216 start_codon:yes stop_codon:yes gene_type:complete
MTNISTNTNGVLNGIHHLDKELWQEFGKNDYGFSQFRNVGGDHMTLIKYSWLIRDALNLNKFIEDLETWPW